MKWYHRPILTPTLIHQPLQFAYVLPGHGEPHRFASPAEAQASLEGCIEVGWHRP